MERQQIRRQPERTGQEEVVETEMPSRDSSIDENALDSLLDEIDLVLEENAQEFIDAYQQKGGQ